MAGRPTTRPKDSPALACVPSLAKLSGRWMPSSGVCNGPVWKGMATWSSREAIATSAVAMIALTTGADPAYRPKPQRPIDGKEDTALQDVGFGDEDDTVQQGILSCTAVDPERQISLDPLCRLVVSLPKRPSRGHGACQASRGPGPKYPSGLSRRRTARSRRRSTVFVGRSPSVPSRLSRGGAGNSLRAAALPTLLSSRFRSGGISGHYATFPTRSSAST